MQNALPVRAEPGEKKETKMTTEKATSILADWLHIGYADIDDMETCVRVNSLMASAVSHGRDWNWGAAGKNIHAAYRALGAKPAGSGYEWHCGEHPVQIEAKKMSDAEMED